MGLGIIPPEQWSIYCRVIRNARRKHVQFAVGGAFAFGVYTGQWRNTKDLDLYIQPKDREVMVDVLTRSGLTDYYTRLPYDRQWIYRSCAGNTIVDIIWSMANHRADVDETWLTAGRDAALNGEPIRAIPAEELIWAKMYVLQRDRCDWGDVLNVLYAVGPGLDWRRLLERLDQDWPLLKSVLALFAWVAPGRARALPEWVWERVELSVPRPSASDVDERSIRLLDSRPWFGPL